MTERERVREALLDALVYAPTGLLLTVLEELPELADKGRRRIEGRITTARVVGQFATQMARQQIEQRRRGQGTVIGFPGAGRPSARPTAPEATGAGASPASGATGHAPATASRTPPDPERTQGDARAGTPGSSDGKVGESDEVGGSSTGAGSGTVGGSSTGAGSGTVGGSSTVGGRAGRRAPSKRSPSRRAGGLSSGAAVGSAPAGTGALGIAGYDTLSASQVVARLAGLSPDQLAAVRAHELAGRHRQTVLHRVEQLLADTGS